MNILKIILNSISNKIYAISIPAQPDFPIASEYGIEPIERMQATMPKVTLRLSILVIIAGIITLILKKKASKKFKIIITVIIAIAIITGIISGIWLNNLEKTYI